LAHIKSDEFINIALESNLDPYTIRKTIQETNPDYTVSSTQIRQRINNYRRQGLIPLDSGNEIGIGEVLKGTSTLKM
jgi:hypothetical protein